MSTFKVSVEKISKIWQHPNADKLELASVEGMTFQFCVGKGIYTEGQKIVYFPIDSVLPDALVEKFNIRNFLAGSKKDRLKTVKLRQEISQGFVAPVDVLFPNEDLAFGSDVTERLGVIKYEPPEVVCKAGRLVQLPSGIEYYDIEGCDRHPAVVQKMLSKLVYVSEKVEGSNFALNYCNDEYNFCQRRFEVKQDPTIEQIHDWIRVPTEMGWTDKIKEISKRYDNKSVVIRGEIAGPGVQGNIYKFQKITAFAFDIKIDGKYIDALDFLKLTEEFGIQTVPTLSVGTTLEEFLAGKTVQVASNGESKLYKTLREGIVIKPLIEEYCDLLGGRLIIKQRDPIYLDKTGH